MNKNQQEVEETDLKNNESGKQKNTVEGRQTELTGEPQDPIAKLEEDIASEKDRYLRLSAEFENYKKRNLRERLELLKAAGADVIMSILPVLDDFERAAKASPLPEGILLIYNKLLNVLEQKGLKAMDSVGKGFDPDLHDAISNMPVEDEALKNKVVDEIEKGYYLNDKVIRHSKVIVGN